jgi:hypothetical protein
MEATEMHSMWFQTTEGLTAGCEAAAGPISLPRTHEPIAQLLAVLDFCEMLLGQVDAQAVPARHLAGARRPSPFAPPASVSRAR